MASVLSRMTESTSSLIAAPPSPLGRERLGRYEIIYPISWGGMASVYAGRLSGIAGFQRLVAIKVVHSHLAAEDKFIKMFLDEARLAAGIHHPNVGEVIEVGEDRGLYYMVGELILGQSLKAVFRRAAERDVVIPHFVSARIASCVCYGLHAAHELKGGDGEPLGLVHRDVSPRNILLTYDGFVKLIDFGVAYAEGRISHTDEGTLKGKIGYMSPEQLRCEPVDRRSDIFSVGVVLYQMVTGRQPFYGTTDIERYNKMMQYEFDRPRDVVPDLNPLLEKIILSAMARHQDERYPTATALAVDLDEYIRQTREVAEPTILPKIMNALFQGEQAYHLEKVRERRKNNGASVSSDLGWVKQNLERTSPYSLRAIRKRQRELTHSRRKKLLVVALVLLPAVIGLYVLATGALNPSPDNGYRVMEEQAGEVSKTSSRERMEAVVSHGSLNGVVDRASVSSTLDSTPVINISLTLNPTNAFVELDGIEFGSGTKELSLPANGAHHRLRVFADDYREETVTLTADSDKSMTISLVPNQRETKKRRGPQWSEKLMKKRKASILEASPYE